MAEFYAVKAFGKKSLETPFEPLTIKRGLTGDNDVEFDIKFCGICHTDVHFALNQWGNAIYPMVPGHELAGIVTKVGKNVNGFKVGDKVGVGCLSESCLKCDACNVDMDELACPNGGAATYNDKIKHGLIKTDTGITYGGYSAKTTANERFAVKIPDSYPLENAGPVFCAGVTMYSPLKQWGVRQGGKKVGVVGIGGLGQMGILLAKAMGNEVTAISRSLAKRESALEMGADHYLVSTDATSLASAADSLDLILNTVSANHEAAMYLPLLRRKGAQVLIGLPSKPHTVRSSDLLFKNLSLAGSMIGTMAETQEVIDFCAEKNIKPQIEIITWDKIDVVFDILEKGNDRIVRYVLDIEKSIKM